MSQTSLDSRMDSAPSRVVSDAQIASETPFLDSVDPVAPIAGFLQEELTVGKLLDHGRFTESFAVVRIDRDLRYQASSEIEEKARLELWESTSTKGRSNYSVKGVRSGLKREREIERAVIGLTIEANYLARLDHPNIVSLLGLSTAASACSEG